MGINVNEVYKSGNTLKAEDLQKREHTLTIKEVELATIPDGDREKKMIDVNFYETDKNLLLNRTNADSISYMFGADTDAWLGKKICLYPTMVPFAGRTVEAIRIRPAQQNEGALNPPPNPNGTPNQTGLGAATPVDVPIASNADFEDDIPF